MVSLTVTFLISALLGQQAQAAGPFSTFTIDGVFYASPNSDTPLAEAGISITAQILDHNKSCVLYEERQVVDTSASRGKFSLHVGSEVGSSRRTSGAGHDPGNSMSQVFGNSQAITAASAGSCGGPNYNPANLGEGRYLRLIVAPVSGPSDALDLFMDGVPRAQVAAQADSLQGLGPNDFLRVNSTAPASLTQPNLEDVFSATKLPLLQALIAGTSTQFLSRSSAAGAALPSYAGNPGTPAAGSVWYDSSSNLIKFWNGSSAQSLGVSGSGITSLVAGAGLTGGTITTSGTVAVDVGTAAGKIVQLDGSAKLPAVDGSLLTNIIATGLSGNIAMTGSLTITSNNLIVSGNGTTTGVITGQALSGNLIQGNLLKLKDQQGTPQYISVQAPANSGASGYLLTLPVSAGNSGEVLSTNGSGVLSWVSKFAGMAATDLPNHDWSKITSGKPTTLAGYGITDSISTSLNAGQILVGNVSNVATAVMMSGDGALSNAGTLTLGTVSVAKGGTGSTSFGNNKVVVSNATGTALLAAPCGLNQTLQFDASGNYTCVSVATLLGGTVFVNGGNSFGAATSFGTNDAQDLILKTNNTAKMTILQNGNVGIGAATPLARLDVTGSAPGTSILRSISSTGVPIVLLIENPTGSGEIIVNDAAGNNRFAVSSPLNNQYADLTASSGEAQLGVYGTSSTGNYSIFKLGVTAGPKYWMMAHKDAISGTQNNLNFEYFDGSFKIPLSITSAGNVGIGDISPIEKLVVAGNLKVTGQAYGSEQSSSASSPLNFDTNSGNTMSWSTGAQTNLTVNINNMKSGGSYTMALRGSGSGSTTINCYSDNGVTALIQSMVPAASSRVANATLFTIQRVGNYCYISWSTGWP